MVCQNKYIKLLVGMAIIIGLFVFLITYNIQESRKPVILNEDYINSELISSDIYIDELLLKTDVDDSGNVICLCREGNSLHIIRFEKKNNNYEFLERYQIEPEKLSEDYTEFIEFSKPFIMASSNKYYIYSSVFLNPKSNSLNINGVSTNIKKVDVKLGNKKYHIGLWVKASLEKTELEFN